ncbi:mandelate racemase/muconate lactonizing enzyme family protein [Vreelandella sp. EE27]
MKIASVTAYPVWVGDRNQLLIAVRTVCGVTGWGESGFSSRELAVAGCLEDLGDWLEGRDPLQPGAIWEAYQGLPNRSRDRVAAALMSAIDIALYDIAGKALDLPVHALLGGACRDRVKTFGCVRADDEDELISLASHAMSKGWSCLRLGWRTDAPPRFDPQDAIARWPEILVQARRALGNRLMLGIDLHHRFSVAEAASFMARAEGAQLDFVEEPIRDEAPLAYQGLRRLTHVPFAIGEEFSSSFQFSPYIEQGLCDFARIDICNVGGFTEAMRVGAWSAAHGLEVMPHNPLGPICTAATVHMAATLRNHSFLECWETPGEDNASRQDSPIFLRRLKLDGADFILPNEPGLGIDVDEVELADAMPFQHSEMPHLRRRDGAFTNW